ncbi:FP1, partial [Symbiodinium microadriaticum]
KHGVDLSKMDWSTIFATFRGQLMDTLTAVIAFSEGIVLTSLMFFFCLYAMLPNPHDKRTFHRPLNHPEQSTGLQFITGLLCQRFRGLIIDSHLHPRLSGFCSTAVGRKFVALCVSLLNTVRTLFP